MGLNAECKRNCRLLLHRWQVGAIDKICITTRKFCSHFSLAPLEPLLIYFCREKQLFSSLYAFTHFSAVLSFIAMANKKSNLCRYLWYRAENNVALSSKKLATMLNRKIVSPEFFVCFYLALSVKKMRIKRELINVPITKNKFLKMCVREWCRGGKKVLTPLVSITRTAWVSQKQHCITVGFNKFDSRGQSHSFRKQMIR